MDSESESNYKDPSVKELQATLFPVVSTPKLSCSTGGYFSNILLKSSHLEIDEEGHQILRKDSKELFAVIREPSSTIQPPRWPTECQVIEERIQHVSYTPPLPEPYYISTGKEVQPKPVGEECGIIVYQYYPISAVNYFSRSSVGGSTYLLPTCPSPEEDGLRFESRFESGNLAKAIRITATYYELYLRTDLYTNKHMQWFYFRITNVKKNVTYRFSIVNMTKDGSLFNEGMKPLLYSEKDAQMHNVGWKRCGDNITYYCNDNVGPDEPDQLLTYTLAFTTDFPHDNDVVYLAYSYPYTYSDLQDYLIELSKHPVKSTFTTLRLLCRTLAGNNVYYVTITNPQDVNESKKKKAVVITARVHPGETPASWMMKGFLDFLTSESGPAKELRDKFIFKLVPMLNPDGVIVGNNRCSLTGRDLNRQYRTVIRETYPSIWYTKLMIRRMLEECGVAMYCDLHAHSRKHSVFIYGCENRRELERRLHEQVFPLMLHKNAADKFSFESCKFRIQRCKEGTGRVVMWMMGISNSYTMEASFGGSIIGTRAETHFSPTDYEQMGRAFCQTLLDFYDDDPRKERLRFKIVERLNKEGSNADEPTNIQLSDYSSDDGDTSSSSSDEVGRDDFSVPLVVPPPSPILPKRYTKSRSTQRKARPLTRSPSVPRKVFPLCKATLGVSLLREKTKNISDTSSDGDTDSEGKKERIKPVRKRRTKKKSGKKRQMSKPNKHSDTEVIDRSSTRCLSVLDLLPVGKFRSQSWHRSYSTAQTRLIHQDARMIRTTTQQLAEVQAKLLSLKNRLWMGVENEDFSVPLSWGTTSFHMPRSASAPKKSGNKKESTKKLSKQEKLERKSAKKSKHKEDEGKERNTKKKQGGLRKGRLAEWLPVIELPIPILKKVKSFPEASKKEDKHKHSKNGDDLPSYDEDDSKTKTKRNKKKSKLQKKAKAVSNAVTFIRKD